MSLTDKTLSIKGMHCTSCALLIKNRLAKLPGIEDCQVSFATEEAKVTYDDSKVDINKMNNEIGKLGYSFGESQVQDKMEGMDHDHMSHMSMEKDSEIKSLKEKMIAIIPMTIVSIFVMVWDIGFDPLKIFPKMPDMLMEFFHHLLPLFAFYSMFIVGKPYLYGIYRFIKYKAANMDTLVGIGTLTAFLYSFALSAFEETLSPYINVEQSYYDVVIIVISFITLGKFLEASSKLKTGEALKKLLGLQAKSAIVERNGKEIEVPISEIKVGEILIVKPGAKIPLDSVIVEGSTSIDESMITGESVPVDKIKGDTVIGSTLNKQGYIKIRVSKVGEETMLSQIINMVKDAQMSKAPIEALADKISAVFVPSVLLIAIITLVVWVILGNVSMAIVSFVGVLVIACPCVMGLATPTAVIVGVGKAAENGILIKNAESLEKFSRVNYVVFDKTGTITNGVPELTDIIPSGKMIKSQILRVLASLEKKSEHPISEAIVKKASEEKVNLLKVENFRAIEGKGLTGSIGGKVYFAGNVKLAKEKDLDVNENTILSLTTKGKTPVILMTKKEIIAYIGVADTVKEDAKEVISKLNEKNIQAAMLTGDNKNTAEQISRETGIKNVIAEVLPQDKALEVKKIQEKGFKVAMIGDGINDAPALAQSEVGVAMGTGTDVAIESAGITLLGGHIIKLIKAIDISHATMNTIKQNLFWAFAYNTILIPLAAGVLFPKFGISLNPAIAGAAMGLSSVSVVLNSLRLKGMKI